MVGKNEIFVKIDLVTVKKLAKLASPHEIEPDLIKRVIEHAFEILNLTLRSQLFFA